MKRFFFDTFEIILSVIVLTLIPPSGCINAMVTTPLWVTNTRMKLQGVLSEEKDGGESSEEALGQSQKKKFKGLIGKIKLYA